METTVGPSGGPDLGQDDRQPVVVAAVDLQLARLQPALDEAGGRAQTLAVAVS